MPDYCFDLLKPESYPEFETMLRRLHDAESGNCLNLSAGAIYKLDGDRIEFSDDLIRLPAQNPGDPVTFLALAPTPRANGCYGSVIDVISKIELYPDRCVINNQTDMLVKCNINSNSRTFDKNIRLLKREYRLGRQMPHMGMHYPPLIDKTEKMAFLPMRKIPGITLNVFIDKHLKKMGMQQRLRLALRLFEAYRDQIPPDVVHGDIKPENIMLDIQGRVYFIDFGLSREESLVKLGRNFGTPDYIEPKLYFYTERQSIWDKQSRETDIFSILLSLMEVFGDDSRFWIKGNTEKETWQQQKVCIKNINFVPKVANISPNEKTELQDLFNQMLSFERANRPYRLDEIIEKLETLLAERIREDAHCRPASSENAVSPLPYFSIPNDTRERVRAYRRKQALELEKDLETKMDDYCNFIPDPIPAWWGIFEEQYLDQDIIRFDTRFEMQWNNQVKGFYFIDALDWLGLNLKRAKQNCPKRGALLADLQQEWMSWAGLSVKEWKSRQKAFSTFIQRFDAQAKKIQTIDAKVSRHLLKEPKETLLAALEALYTRLDLSPDGRVQMDLLLLNLYHSFFSISVHLIAQPGSSRHSLPSLLQNKQAWLKDFLSREALIAAYNNGETDKLLSNACRLTEIDGLYANAKKIDSLNPNDKKWYPYPVFTSISRAISDFENETNIHSNRLEEITDAFEAMDYVHKFYTDTNKPAFFRDMLKACKAFSNPSLSDWGGKYLPALEKALDLYTGKKGNITCQFNSILSYYDNIILIKDAHTRTNLLYRLGQHTCRWMLDINYNISYDLHRLNVLMEHHLSVENKKPQTSDFLATQYAFWPLESKSDSDLYKQNNKDHNVNQKTM